eukprot:m.127823 g.127823  ORF g.127823 m.127823 type:complete len:242 (-) comp15664_c3_seq2:899-1624(-)
MGGKSSRQSDALDQLDVAITNLRETSEGFRQKAVAAIDMMSNRLDDLERRVALAVAHVRGDPAEPEATSHAKLADALQQLNFHDDVVQSAMYEVHGARPSRGTFDESDGEEGTEGYQLFRKDSFRVEIFSKRHDVTLRRLPQESFGLTIVAAHSASSSGTPGKDHAIFIKSIKSGSVAELDGRLRTHDRVLAINDIDVSKATHEQVIGLISASGREVKLTVATLIKVKRRRKPNDAKSSRR